MDHLVYATPELAATVAWFADLTGVPPVRGGQHEGLGTANFLVGLGGASYLEIIGPDPDQPDPAVARPFGIDLLAAPSMVTWAIAVPDMAAALAAARNAGVDPGDANPMSRRTGTREVLRWQLTPPTFAAYDGLVPFLIDWGGSTHPTEHDLPAVGLVDWHGSHDDPARIRHGLAAVGAQLKIVAGQPGLSATLRGPAGEVVLS